MRERDDELLTVVQVMARLNLGRSKVYDLIRTRRLRSVTIGRCRRIPASAIGEFIAGQMERAA
ncbi:helix-turn-helix domain-containing protein [Streptomyces griseoviridis]|uniref:helix-turn-helix domain-containing protein n=1 Tax=Streptomyces sp. NPDC096080 TaxID=3156693 RepID=UPI0033268A32